jgi:hypothetical protein
LEKHEYNHQECLLHKNKVVEVVGQVVEAMEQMGLQSSTMLIEQMKHHNQLQLLR